MRQEIRSALYQSYTEPIRDPLWGHVYFTKPLAALTESDPFMRLHRIMQLGPAYAVYPGATHTRASHSIGVYHLARRLLCHLAEAGADTWLSPEGIYSFLSAALLHDLGHFPYTHSLKELPLLDHEVLTGQLILQEPLRGLIKNAGAHPDFTAAIIDDTMAPGGAYDPGELQFYRKLLSGSLDPDKLDYLSRDARYCGVPYGVQDVDFILSRLLPHADRGLDIDSRGISGVESLLFSKYLMYRAVYWHRMVRSATAMVKKALLRGLDLGLIQAGELYGQDDQGLFHLAKEKGSPLKPLMDRVSMGRFYHIAGEFPFLGEIHGKLLDLTERSVIEEGLREELSPLFGRALGMDEIIIDLPEEINFECGLYVADEEAYFTEGSSAFKKALVDGLVRSLRVIRVFIDPAHEGALKLHREGILQICKKWLGYI